MNVFLLSLILSQTPMDSLLEVSLERMERGVFLGNGDSIVSAYDKIKYVAEVRGSSIDLYLLSYGIYRLYTMKIEDYQKEGFLDSAIYYLEKSIKINPEFSDAYALLGNFYGMKAGDNPLAGMVYSKKSNDAFREALEKDSLNPRAWYLQGVSVLYTPKAFGGGPQKALKYFKKALTLFKKGYGKKGLIRWGEPDCMVFLGIAYEAMDSLNAARNAYKKTLEIYPDYGWALFKLNRIEAKKEK